MSDNEEPQAQKVQVYVYDISHGLARSLSMGFLGIQLDAIYHTGIVINKTEYYFDTEDVTALPAGTTRFGIPQEVLDCGETYIPQDVFHEFLEDMKEGRFKFGSYNVLRNNCNHFTHDALQFLNGQDLDVKILNLPEQVLSSPNGAMIEQMFGAMSAPR